MNTVIQWCNANQGFLSACLTFVYVSATIWLVRLGQRQLHQAVELDRNRSRPVVVLDMFFERYHWYVRVANVGQRVALEVKIEIEPKLEYVYGGEGSVPRDERSKPIPFIERSIPTLAPNREIKALVGFSRRVHQAYPKLRFEGVLSYRTADGEHYKEPFIIDVAAIEALAYRSTKDIEDVAKQLEDIAGTFRRVASGSATPLVRTMTEKEHRDEEDRFLESLQSGDSEHPGESKGL